ncbi:Eukaryotic translation initiation factor 3 subunit [Trichinella spiralis]|uniref:Eukaryotic translation initiation factor 3 subunit n=1 Tax=Trichinella spiralis TaxID=6334 RepID=A0ABR3KV87_TRISP
MVTLNQDVRTLKIPPSEFRQKSYRNCGCNLASISQPHPLPQRAAEVNDRHSCQVSLTATNDSVETAHGNASGKDLYRRRDLPLLSKGRLL